ncbi:MAG TPA: NADH:flavin oxidoreductase/NADH oxidase [Tepidisphaeraceae bacterium]|jgi:2,4-dienoyl-CoA reductase-like NADH-dependent reductase (Old Yellow Enzyme family)
MSRLFSPLALRDVTFKNRIFVSPMCQYSSDDGLPTDWHLVHLGSRAVGGAAMVMVEATAITPEGRISPWDSGIWSDAHADAFMRITDFIRRNHCVPGVQLAHAGRKASTDVPWRGGKVLPAGRHPLAWEPLAPSPIPFHPDDPPPREMTRGDIDRLVADFSAAARRAARGGFEVVEVHAAHGYLLHEFLSPLSNHRTDEYGGSFEDRTRLLLRVATEVRAAWPARWPVFVRLSCTDWVEGGWDLEQSVRLAILLKEVGVDLIDCSSGGLVPGAKIPVAPGYQVPFAFEIKHKARIATGAVGLITDAHQAEQIVAQDKADALLLARAFLRNPYWPLHAAKVLEADIPWPDQYARARG